MKEGQNDIYYMIGESLESITDSAFIEELKKRDLEVLFMTDPMDEFVMNGMTEYLGKRLVCTSSLDLELLEDKKKERFAQVMAEFEPTCAVMKEILGDKVESVIVSNRLVASPSCIVTSTSGWSANMHRIQRAQTLENPNVVLNNCVKKHLEINPNDPIILRLKEMISSGSKPIKVCGDVLNMLYNTALLNSGFSLEKPRSHTKTIYRLIRKCVQIAASETTMDEGKVTASSANAVLTLGGDDCGAMDTIS
ncbi:Heat shock cognate protein HSP 90-beta [Echinococcus granulosus]|nr:Heat shock cognate protein HSP 90-beta [Echinococcus granulosus]